MTSTLEETRTRSARPGPTSTTPASSAPRAVQLRALDFEAGAAALAPIQRAADAAAAVDDVGVHAAASRGLAGGGGALPHAAAIQRSFGRHDVSGVDAHVGGAAADACDAIGAQAYASGGAVAFKGAPDLHTAAHEAAHVVQQKAGVQLAGGVGAAGDPYERHADAVADAVVQGKSAEGLLDRFAGGPAHGAPGGERRAIQRKAGPALPAAQLDLSGIWSKASSVGASGGVQKATWNLDTPEFPFWGPLNCKMLLNGEVSFNAGGKVAAGGDTELSATLAGALKAGLSFGVGSSAAVRLALNTQLVAGVTGIKWTYERSGKQKKHTLELPSVTFSGEISASLEGDMWPMPWSAVLLNAWIMKTEPMTWCSDAGFTFDSRRVVWNTELFNKLAERFDGRGQPKKAQYIASGKQMAVNVSNAASAKKLVDFCDMALAKKGLSLEDIRGTFFAYNNVRDTIARNKGAVRAKDQGLQNLILAQKGSSMSAR